MLLFLDSVINKFAVNDTYFTGLVYMFSPSTHFYSNIFLKSAIITVNLYSTLALATCIQNYSRKQQRLWQYCVVLLFAIVTLLPSSSYITAPSLRPINTVSFKLVLSDADITVFQ